MDSLNILNWCIDSAHQVHEDCKGHTGETLTLGQGAVTSKSSGQKMNTKSSSETELVGVDDLLPTATVLWTKYFVEAQGYNVEHNIIHQDSESTLRMLILRRFFWQRIIATKAKLSLQNATRRNVGRYVD